MFTPKREETSREGGESVPEDKRQGRSSTIPSRPQLTEQTLLQLEQSLPNYRLAQRNLSHWLFYIESTVQDTFDTYRSLPDPDFYPSAFDGPYSSVSLSQADFQESHHSPAGSSDLFGFTVRSPREIQVVIPSRAHSPVHPPQSSVIQPRSPLLLAPQEEAPFEFFHFDSEPPPSPQKLSNSDSDPLRPSIRRAPPSRSPSPPSHPPRLTRLRPHKRYKPFDPSSIKDEVIEIPDSQSDG
jgi:hypothetical protein